MALDNKDGLGETLPVAELRDDDRFAGYDDDGERSHFGAFLMGGFVVAGGLLAFLYYDSDTLNDRADNELTTGSIIRMEAPAGSAVPSLRLIPSQNGSENR